MYDIDDSLLKKLLDASFIVTTAPADLIVHCDINSLHDKEVQKLLKQLDTADRLLNSFISSVFLDKLLEGGLITVPRELAAS